MYSCMVCTGVELFVPRFVRDIFCPLPTQCTANRWHIRLGEIPVIVSPAFAKSVTLAINSLKRNQKQVDPVWRNDRRICCGLQDAICTNLQFADGRYHPHGHERRLLAQGQRQRFALMQCRFQDRKDVSLPR